MEITEERFNTEFVDRKIETQPYLDSTTRGALTAWFEANDSIEPVFVDREEWEKRKEEGTILGEELDEDDDKRRLYLAEDLNIFEMIDVVSAVDKDTFKDNPELATQGVEKIQKLAETFKKAGVYIDQSISYVDKGRDIAEELSKKFFNYGLSLESKTKVEGEAIPPTVLSESEKRELDKWLIGKELYHKIMDRLGPNPSQEDIDKQRKKYFRGYFKALSSRGFKSEGDNLWQSDGLVAKIHKATERGIEREVNRPDIELYNAAFRRGKNKLKQEMRIPLTAKNLWEKLGNIMNSGFKTDRQKLYDYLEIPRLKEELAEVRSRGDIEEISKKEIEIASSIKEVINKYQYRKPANNPSEILKNNYLNCLGSTLLGTSLLDEVGIKYLYVSPPEHATTFLVTSDKKLYWQDFTPSNYYFWGGEVRGSLFEGDPDILKLAENFDSFSLIHRFDKKSYNISSSVDAKAAALMGNLHFALYKAGKHKESDEIVRKATELNPNSYALYYNLGVNLTILKRYGEANELFRKAIELNPTSHKLYYYIGTVLVSLGRYDEAREAYQKGLEVHSEASQLTHHLINSFCNTLERLDRFKQLVKIAKNSRKKIKKT